MVSDFGFVNNDFNFIVISFLILYLFLTGSMDSLTCCLCEWPQSQNEVSDFGFGNDDFGFIVISFLILYLF